MNLSRSTIIAVLLALLSIGLGFFLFAENKENNALKAANDELSKKLASTERDLEEVTKNSSSLLDALQAEQQKSGFLQEQASTFSVAVQKLTGTVNNLEKLSKTDPELLIKYSKVYFLNEHYIPERLVQIPKEFVHMGDEEYIHARVFQYLENLLKEAKSDGNELKIISAFRSFETQKDLKTQYSVVFGAGANKFSAEQGYSEHQLGTTADFTTEALGNSFSSFDKTEAFNWLNSNAHRFGFVLSYPKGNSYYIYEPWHWRFVGVELATRLYSERKSFYDMEQRDINEYLIKIFN